MDAEKGRERMSDTNRLRVIGIDGRGCAYNNPDTSGGLG